MVARIKEGYSMHRIINYNENKVKEGVADLLAAVNFTGDLHRMSSKFRLDYMLHHQSYHPTAGCTTVHISLNFSPSESNLTTEKLAEITTDYMEGIGFGRQPYMVYQHHDAGHPHVHIVTTNVQTNGKLISLHRLGYRKSEPTRKALEEKYGLVRAEDQPKQDEIKAKMAFVQKAIYGKSDTRKAIQIVLGAVIDQYRYSSLAELNAVLGLYNIKAERGSEDSRVFKRGGLLYRVLDEKGQTIGVPIKASAFATPATLRILEEKFTANEPAKALHKARVKNAIDFALLSGPVPLKNLIAELEQQGIAVILRQNEQGQLYGLTYVDHTSRCVFNGSSLGKPYSAKAIQERCNEKELPHRENSQKQSNKPVDQSQTKSPRDQAARDLPMRNPLGSAADMLEQLMNVEQAPEMKPGSHKRKRRKKRKNSSNT